MEDGSVLALVRDTDVPVVPTKEYMKWKWDLIFSVLQVGLVYWLGATFQNICHSCYTFFFNFSTLIMTYVCTDCTELKSRVNILKLCAIFLYQCLVQHPSIRTPQVMEDATFAK